MMGKRWLPTALGIWCIDITEPCPVVRMRLNLLPALGWTVCGSEFSLQSSVKEKSSNLSRDSMLSCKDRTCCPRGALQMPTHHGKIESILLSLALPTPFPFGKRSPVLVNSRLFSEFRWTRNFSPILFRDVQKTSSINPHIRTMCSTETNNFPESISADIPDLQHWCPPSRWAIPVYV